jgi:hypothetical protein
MKRTSPKSKTQLKPKSKTQLKPKSKTQLKPKPKSKPRPKSPDIIFTRRGRIPKAVEEASNLWLDMFMHTSGLTAPEVSEAYLYQDIEPRKAWLTRAAELADHALGLYESRWPHRGHEGK